MAKDRLYELDGKKGHWYTDEQGNRYFVAQGQTPKEGWEATKRRKMIKGGKYVKDDGDDKGEQEISADEYQTYEADEEERFDETTDADFEDDKPEDFDRDPLIDSEEPLFDEYQLSTKKGIEEAKNFLDAKGVKDIDALNNEQFDALADEAAKKYGIDRALAQEFLVAPYDEEISKPQAQPKQKPSASSSLYKGVDIVSTPGGHFINDEKNSIQYSFETIDKAKEYIDNAEKAKGGMFDQSGLVTEKGKAASDEFKREKGIKNYYSLSNDQFNALAKEAMEKYGIKDFELAQEFLISNSQDDEDFNKLLEIRRKPKQGSFKQVFGGTSEVEDEKEAQPDGYYKDDDGKIYMTKGGKDYYPVGEEEERDFIRAFDNQNREKAKELANDPETARSFERIYSDLDKGFEETYGRKPTQEEKDAIRDIARLQTALAVMARKK